MKGNRKKAEEYILSVIKDIDPTGRTLELTKQQFAKMDDSRFAKYMERMKEQREFIPLIADVEYTSKVTTEDAINVCEKHNVEIFQRIWYRHPITDVMVLSNFKVPVLTVMVRRQIETLLNKLSTAENNTKVDVLTGQPIEGASAFTQPEASVYLEKGLEGQIIEKLKYRGGDIEGGRLFDQSILETGQVSTEQLYDNHRTTTRSVQTADIYLTSAHYETNLDPTK